jgi:iron complex transport system substrate-binding protein
MAGRNVAVPAQVNRFATAYPAVNQMVFMLGAADKLVATSQDAANQALFVTLYPRLKDIPAAFDTGLTQVNRETLLANGPEVVFISSTNQALRDAIEATGIPVVVLATFTGPDQIKAGLNTVAEVLGGDAPARAQRFASYYDGNVARVQAVTASIPESSRPTALYNGGDPLVTEGQGSIVTTWMTQGGARNVAAESGITGVLVPITLEAVLGANPDYIICRDPSTKPKVLQDPRWANVTAVRENHVLVQPQGIFPGAFGVPKPPSSRCGRPKRSIRTSFQTSTCDKSSKTFSSSSTRTRWPRRRWITRSTPPSLSPLAGRDDDDPAMRQVVKDCFRQCCNSR